MNTEYHKNLPRKKGWDTKFSVIIWDMQKVFLELREELKTKTYIDNRMDKALLDLDNSIIEYLKYIGYIPK